MDYDDLQFGDILVDRFGDRIKIMFVLEPGFYAISRRNQLDKCSTFVRGKHLKNIGYKYEKNIHEGLRDNDERDIESGEGDKNKEGE